MRCKICGKPAGSIQEAIRDHWVFSFMDGEFLLGPACADCSNALFRADGEGEREVKDIYRGRILYQDEGPGDYLDVPLIVDPFLN